ncbi:hydrogenase subunit MbhD domain-containing protein [Aquabacter sp. CN5-332]|uniref:hydrogenase subunit MbhD domain-containing protein n=1 Tax=Aquabacter sp. CN5-332 TaxID=3156608 RepID=UPI0032B4D89F
MSVLLDFILLLLALALAFRVATVQDTLGAVIAFVGLGIVLALVWVRLDAIDVALTEAAVGSGITGLLLVRAASRLPSSQARAPAPALKLAAGLLSALLAGALAAVVLLLPEPAPTLALEAARHLPQTGLGNPVTAVLVAYRALDTLLETVVLLLALVGVWSLGPDRAWGGHPEPLAPMPAAPPLSFLGRVLPPFGILLGVHLAWTGADNPGGAFQGGAVIAAMLLLLLMAGHARMPALSGQRLRVLVILGPAVFMLIGLVGVLATGSFLGFPESIAKPLILFVEAALILSIAVALGLLVAGPATRAAQ